MVNFALEVSVGGPEPKFQFGASRSFKGRVIQGNPNGGCVVTLCAQWILSLLISHPAVWAKLKLQKASERWQPDTEVGSTIRPRIASSDRAQSSCRREVKNGSWFTAVANIM